jgi:hypothetical protein
MALLEVGSAQGVFLVEVKAGPGLAGVANSDPQAVVGKAEASLEDVLDCIARIGSVASERFSKLKIERADLELGVKFGAKGGFFFAEASGEATLSVKISLKGAM